MILKFFFYLLELRKWNSTCQYVSQSVIFGLLFSVCFFHLERTFIVGLRSGGGGGGVCGGWWQWCVCACEVYHHKIRVLKCLFDIETYRSFKKFVVAKYVRNHERHNLGIVSDLKVLCVSPAYRCTLEVPWNAWINKRNGEFLGK